MNKKNIIYLKEIERYEEVIKNKRFLFLKNFSFLFKTVFNKITKIKFEEIDIWILPIKDKISDKKINKIIQKNLSDSNNIYLLSNKLNNNRIHKILEEHGIKYITEEKIKKVLLIDILEYIASIQNKEINNYEITLLINGTSDLNMYLIEKISNLVKSLKIVSLNIYKFKKIEEKLYKEYGIPIQFSNSYKNSLKKSNIIINLDYNNIEINEYEIFDKAIIINMVDENIKIKSKLFNGIIINSCNIEFYNKIIDKFQKMNIYNNYNKLSMYASIIENYDLNQTLDKVKKDNVKIINLVGNNGIINKKEFKNIAKRVDKNKKTG